MYLLFTSLLIIIVGTIIAIKFNKDKYWYNNIEIVGIVSAFLGGIISLCLIMGLWINHSGIKKDIYRHKMLQQQYNTIRKDDSNTIERAALAKDIIEYNMRLSSQKYDNTTQWDWWTCDKIAELDYIK